MHPHVCTFHAALTAVGACSSTGTTSAVIIKDEDRNVAAILSQKKPRLTAKAGGDHKPVRTGKDKLVCKLDVFSERNPATDESASDRDTGEGTFRVDSAGKSSSLEQDGITDKGTLRCERFGGW